MSGREPDWNDDFVQALAEPKLKACAAARFIATMSPNGQAAILKALADESVSLGGIQRGLRAMKVYNSPSNEAWRKHRNGACACEKESN